MLDQRQERMASQDLDSRFAYDPLLGYTQRPGFAAADLTYDQQRLSQHAAGGHAGTPDGPPILATGDSYTQGDEVPDDQTSRPAYLQAIVGRRTISTPASQPMASTRRCSRRTEQLAAKREAVGDRRWASSPSDLRRAEMRRTLGAPRSPTSPPHEGRGAGVLHNVPVPPSPPGRRTRSRFLALWALGWSVLVDTVLDPPGIGVRVGGADHKQRDAAPAPARKWPAR